MEVNFQALASFCLDGGSNELLSPQLAYHLYKTRIMLFKSKEIFPQSYPQ
jgi:hypothetical protein